MYLQKIEETKHQITEANFKLENNKNEIIELLDFDIENKSNLNSDKIYSYK